jgi:hypothetical protein
LLTLPVSALVWRRWGVVAAAAAWLSGVAIDIDHLPDYFWTRWRGRKSHYFAPLHAWELLAALLVVAKLVYDRSSARARRLPDRVIVPESRSERVLAHPLIGEALIGLAAGMWFHMVLDVLVNRPKHPGVYSVLYRIRHGFTRESTGWSEMAGFHHWSDLSWHRWYRAI